MIHQYDILVSEYDTIDADVLSLAKRLKLLVCCRGGVKTVVDIAEARKKGVLVCNTAGRNANAVSDMTIGYILDMTRNISMCNRLVHEKIITSNISTKPTEYKDVVWGLDDNSPFQKFRGASVNHMVLGLVGFGHAGQLVARKALAFGMKVLYYDPYIEPMELMQDVERVSFESILTESDVVSLHCIVNNDTVGMFTYDTFCKMKKGSYFINTSRGELVCESALVSALNSGHLAGAAIDVSIREPIDNESPLLGTETLIITPHIAGSSYDVQVQGSYMVKDNISDWLQGKTPRNCI